MSKENNYWDNQLCTISTLYERLCNRGVEVLGSDLFHKIEKEILERQELFSSSGDIHQSLDLQEIQETCKSIHQKYFAEGYKISTIDKKAISFFVFVGYQFRDYLNCTYASQKMCQEFGSFDFLKSKTQIAQHSLVIDFMKLGSYMGMCLSGEVFDPHASIRTHYNHETDDLYMPPKAPTRNLLIDYLNDYINRPDQE